jgi:hypothetical protein
VVIVGALGCGDSGRPPTSAATPDRLAGSVRLTVDGRRRFRFNASDPVRHVVRFHEVTVVRPDGRGTFASAGSDRVFPFTVPAARLGEIARGLDDLDFEYLGTHYGVRPSSGSTSTLSYGDQRVVVSPPPHAGGGAPKLDPFDHLVATIRRLGSRAVPAGERPPRAHATCAQLRRFAAKVGGAGARFPRTLCGPNARP